MQWAIINTQLKEGHTVLRQLTCAFNKCKTGSSQRPLHVAHSCPIPLRKMRKERHNLSHKAPTHCRKGSRTAVCCEDLLRPFSVRWAEEPGFSIESTDIH